jgi:toxin ParE1/3/4
MTIEWKVEANHDLDRIIQFVATHQPGRERGVVFSIIAAIELLETQTAMGRAGRVAGTREWPAVVPWVIVYRVERQALIIVRVLHSRQKWPPDSTR